MKGITALIPLGGALLLAGCAGTATDFECNATTSDTCMTMEQANEKAKTREEGTQVKPAAAGLPRLADGTFRTRSPETYPLPPQSIFSATAVTKTSGGMLSTAQARHADVAIARTATVYTPPVTPATFRSPATLPGNYPRPLRKGEQTASLWIAPYIDSGDVYHQPTTVVFVVTPSAWGQPRIN